MCADLQIRVGGRLPRSVNRDPTAGRLNGRAGLMNRQLRPVALLAQMQQNEVANLVAPRSLQHRTHQLRSLIVRQMSPVSQVAGDEGRRASRRFLHGHVVVELDAQDVDVGQAVSHALRPASGVGQVADSGRPGPALVDALDAEAEGGTIVTGRDGLDTKAARREEGPVVVVPHQVEPVKLLEAGVGVEDVAMRFVAIKDDAMLHERLQRGGIDVIAVRVRERDRADPRPVAANAAQPLVESSGPQPDIDQEP